MIDIQKTFLSEILNERTAEISCLLIPGILPQKPVDDARIGKAWVKQSRNGRTYYKMKFDCFMTGGGKALYARGRARQSDPKTFDLTGDSQDMPLRARYPLLMNHAEEIAFVSRPCDDGSLDLMIDHDFMFAD